MQLDNILKLLENNQRERMGDSKLSLTHSGDVTIAVSSPSRADCTCLLRHTHLRVPGLHIVERPVGLVLGIVKCM